MSDIETIRQKTLIYCQFLVENIEEIINENLDGPFLDASISDFTENAHNCVANTLTKITSGMVKAALSQDIEYWIREAQTEWIISTLREKSKGKGEEIDIRALVRDFQKNIDYFKEHVRSGNIEQKDSLIFKTFVDGTMLKECRNYEQLLSKFLEKYHSNMLQENIRVSELNWKLNEESKMDVQVRLCKSSMNKMLCEFGSENIFRRLGIFESDDKF